MTTRTIRRREPGTIGNWPDGTSALLQRLHAARGAPSLETAQPGLRHLLPPDSLSGLDDATALLTAAMTADRHIVVVGDTLGAVASEITDMTALITSSTLIHLATPLTARRLLSQFVGWYPA